MGIYFADTGSDPHRKDPINTKQKPIAGRGRTPGLGEVSGADLRAPALKNESGCSEWV